MLEPELLLKVWTIKNTPVQPLTLAELHVFVLRSLIKFNKAPTNLMKFLPIITMV